jgi:hypothetical protein
MRKEMIEKIKKITIVLVIALFFIAGAVSCGDDNGEKPDEPTCVCPPQGEHFLTCEEYGCEIGGCEITEKARDQAPITLINLFDEGFTATVKGHFTDTEWVGVAGKIEIALNAAFDNAPSGPAGNAYRQRFRNVFATTNGYTIEVVRTSESDEWSKWKATEDEWDTKTLLLGFDELDNNLKQSIVDAVTAIGNGVPGMARVKPMNVVEFAKSLGATKGKFAKYTNTRNNVQFKTARYTL